MRFGLVFSGFQPESGAVQLVLGQFGIEAPIIPSEDYQAGVHGVIIQDERVFLVDRNSRHDANDPRQIGKLIREYDPATDHVEEILFIPTDRNGAGWDIRQDSFLAVGDQYFYVAQENNELPTLWHYHGGKSVEITPDLLVSFSPDIHWIDEQLFFVATGPLGTELYRYSGGIVEVVGDLAPSVKSSFPSQLTTIGDGIVFRAEDVTHGSEVWVMEIDPTVGWSRTNLAIHEGASPENGSPDNFPAAIIRYGDLSAEVTVDITIIGGTASVGDDFTVSSFTFAPGVKSAILFDVLTFPDDMLVEWDETIVLKLSSRDGQVGSSDTLIVTILDD